MYPDNLEYNSLLSIVFRAMHFVKYLLNQTTKFGITISLLLLTLDLLRLIDNDTMQGNFPLLSALFVLNSIKAYIIIIRLSDFY